MKKYFETPKNYALKPQWGLYSLNLLSTIEIETCRDWIKV